MTGRKARIKHAQSHLHQPSDYESDAYNLSDVPVPPPTRSNAELNISVIRRHKPDVVSILSIAPFAVVYLFSPSTQQWEKRDVEGTLFVCQLAPSMEGAERYAVMVLNRKGLENFVAELLNGDDVEITDQYVILQVAGDGDVAQIVGLWIFEDTPTTRTINAQIIQDCAIQAETSQNAVQQDEEEGLQVDVADAGPEPALGEAMARQLSLRELFEQRKQDDGWSVHENSTVSQSAQSAQPMQSQFRPSADTDFFHRAQRNAPTHVRQRETQHQPNVPLQAASQPEVLLNLFRTAKAGL